ncbi:predicted protein, partial [Nematostella vectensis]
MALQTSAYGILILLSLAGNSLIIAAVARNTNKRMRTVSNILIVNLCVADLIVTLCNMPGKIAQIHIGQIWLVKGMFGYVLCKVMGFVPYIGATVSAHSFALLSIDRFAAVFFPIKRPITGKVVTVLITLTWIFVFGFYFVYLHSSEVEQYQNITKCSLNITKVFHTEENFNRFVCAEFFVVTVIPLFISAVLYTATMVKLFKRRIPGMVTPANASYTLRVNRRIMKMLVTVYAVFFLCWCPSWIWVITCLFVPSPHGKRAICTSTQYHIFRFIAAYSNSAITPYLYLIFSENYRRG